MSRLGWMVSQEMQVGRVRSPAMTCSKSDWS